MIFKFNKRCTHTHTCLYIYVSGSLPWTICDQLLLLPWTICDQLFLLPCSKECVLWVLGGTLHNLHFVYLFYCIPWLPQQIFSLPVMELYAFLHVIKKNHIYVNFKFSIVFTIFSKFAMIFSQRTGVFSEMTSLLTSHPLIPFFPVGRFFFDIIFELYDPILNDWDQQDHQIFHDY